MSFEQDIANAVQKYAPQFNVKVYSPAIAQAILESAHGKSSKAEHHNYHGLKYRANRCPSSNHVFIDGSKEEYSPGQLTNIVDTWFGFPSLDLGVKGYFEFINISNYSKTKNESDPRKYLQALKDAKYATDTNYVNKLMNVINTYNLTKYDIPKNVKVLYKVQVGAYSLEGNAKSMQTKLLKYNIPSIIVTVNISGKILHRVQVGAYSDKNNATAMQKTLATIDVNSIIVEQ